MFESQKRGEKQNIERCRMGNNKKILCYFGSKQVHVRPFALDDLRWDMFYQGRAQGVNPPKMQEGPGRAPHKEKLKKRNIEQKVIHIIISFFLSLIAKIIKRN